MRKKLIPPYFEHMKLLLVDAGDVLRPRMVDALSEIEGVEVSAGAQGADGALLLTLGSLPDVVVVDIQMVRGALDLVRAIKSISHPPIVITLSSSSSIWYRAACHNAGAELFFDKVREQLRLVEAVEDLQKELGSRSVENGAAGDSSSKREKKEVRK